MREMKDSGVEWIGEIPEDWEICRFKNVAELYTGNSIKDEEKEQYEDSVDARPYIATKDIDITFGNVNYTNGLFVKLDDYSFKIAPRNSTLMCIEGGSAGRKKAKLSNDVAFVNKLCCFFSNKVDNTFLYYFLCSPNYEKEFTNNMSGLIGGVSVSVLKNISFLLPPPEHQHRIADYLDNKCAKIDAIITREQAVIEKLKAYKLSVITEAVTKGLNSDVPMKDSGIEWVDIIPATWSAAAVKKVTDFVTCGVAATPEYTDADNGFLFLSAQNVKDGKMDYSIKRYITAELHESLTKKRIPQKGDILQVRVGASIGNAAIVDTDEPFSVYVSLTHMRVNYMINNQYFMYSLLTPLFQQKAMSYVDFAGSQGNLNVADLRMLKVPVPPMQEQQQIVDYLDNKCSKIDFAIDKKQTIIDKLTEYKKTLIYEVVTGKKEV